MARRAQSPIFNRSRFDGEGAPMAPVPARPWAYGWGGSRGLRENVIPGTRAVPIRRPWGRPFQSQFPDLYTDQNPHIAPKISPAIHTAENNYSPISHRGGTTWNDTGSVEWIGGGHLPFAVPGAGPLDPIPAGKAINRARWNSGAIPAARAIRPSVKIPGPENQNRRGGQGAVVGYPLARPGWPLYAPGVNS